mmetsp:Transcript_46083/g.84461  ORF Transcript_46083/g.84461 Transcript_46083/m.84461 type:complete len:169 (-) Transcript_46083:39-545(-)
MEYVFKVWNLCLKRAAQSDGSACKSGTSVAGCLRVIKSAFAEVIFVLVADHGSSDDGMLTSEFDESVFVVDLGDTVAISNDVAHVTDVSLFVFGATVLLAVWVEVGTSGLAAFNEVPELVNVETVVPFSKTGHFSDNSGLGTLGLDELDDSFDSRATVWAQNADSVVS